MPVPSFNTEILRRPEALMQLIQTHSVTGSAFKNMADAAYMMITSSATNDYLEKIGAEAVGARHLSAKLGMDAIMPDGVEIEIKPKKGSTPNATSGGVINDDTPMKLKKASESYQLVVFINATKESKVNWAVVAPFKYWNNTRYANIVKKLGLNESNWSWPLTELPEDPSACLTELLTKHRKGVYVRSSNLHLSVLKNIPVEERNVWVHPELDVKKLPKMIKEILA